MRSILLPVTIGFLLSLSMSFADPPKEISFKRGTKIEIISAALIKYEREFYIVKEGKETWIYQGKLEEHTYYMNNLPASPTRFFIVIARFDEKEQLIKDTVISAERINIDPIQPEQKEGEQ